MSKASSYFQDWMNRFIISHELVGYSIEKVNFEARELALYEYFNNTVCESDESVDSSSDTSMSSEDN